MSDNGNGDRRDQYSDAIDANFRAGNWAVQNRAREMVSNRSSKGALVHLVAWLLARAEDVEAQNVKLIAEKERELAALKTRLDVFSADHEEDDEDLSMSASELRVRDPRRARSVMKDTE